MRIEIEEELPRTLGELEVLITDVAKRFNNIAHSEVKIEIIDDKFIRFTYEEKE